MRVIEGISASAAGRRRGVDGIDFVMRGLDPCIHLLRKSLCGMDRRVKPGDDEKVRPDGCSNKNAPDFSGAFAFQSRCP
jgi:hypothetical protein